MATDEVDRRARLRLGQRIRSRPALLELQAPVAREVAVHVDPSDAVLVEVAVPVVVDAFGVEIVETAAEFAGGATHHHPVVSGADPPKAVGIRDPHLGHRAVPVEIVAGILVQQTVAVFVVRSRCAPQTVGCGECDVGSVGIEFGTHVQRSRIQQARHTGIVSVTTQHVPRKVQRHLGAGQFRCVNVAVVIVCRLLVRRSGCLIGNLQDHERRTLERLANRVKVREPGIHLRPSSQQGVRVGGAVERCPIGVGGVLSLSDTTRGEDCREND